VDEAVDKVVENLANPHQKRACNALAKKQPIRFSINKINELQTTHL